MKVKSLCAVLGLFAASASMAAGAAKAPASAAAKAAPAAVTAAAPAKKAVNTTAATAAAAAPGQVWVNTDSKIYQIKIYFPYRTSYIIYGMYDSDNSACCRFQRHSAGLGRINNFGTYYGIIPCNGTKTHEKNYR